MAFAGPNWKPAKGSARLGRHERRQDDEKKLLDTYAEVDARDGSICWVTGRYTVPAAPDGRVRRSHHHLKGRNVRPDWVYKAKRIITVCQEAHDLIEGGFIDVQGTNANKPIFFHWNAVMANRKKPFVIKSKHLRGAA